MTAMCEEIYFLMNLALDGEISADEQRQLDQHRATCPHCQALWEELCQMQTAMGQLEDLAPSDGFKDRVLAQIASEKATAKVVPLRRQWKAVAGLAACALLCVTLFPSLNMGSDTSSADLAMMSVYDTAVTTTSTSAVAETYVLDGERAVESMDTTASTATTNAETTTTESTSYPEQVAQMLEVEEIHWIIIQREELDYALASGVEMEELVTTETFSYAVMTGENWQTVRTLVGFATTQDGEDGIPFVVIVQE